MRQLHLLLALSATLAEGFPALGNSGTECTPTGIHERATSRSRKALKGKFLLLTDVHPDPFYKVYSSTEHQAACHRSQGPAGFYGAEISSCDSPLSLVNETFKWIEKYLKDEVDFVLWTGDSARHDNDEKIPRTPQQVEQQNRMLVQKFTEVWGKDENINDTDPTNDFLIPIIPTFGNNDVMPHNIMEPGPNKWTSTFLDVWRPFIPEEQRHQFQRGGWFYVEAIPNKLAIFSLNTMYFFDSNSAVDGCAPKSEPGYEHMEWLRIQLGIIRERNMKAILIGHVPPARTDNKMSWDETCWQKYTLWLRQYRDIVIGSFFGHMNMDHFMLQDSKDVDIAIASGDIQSPVLRTPMDEEISISSASDYLVDLRDAWAKLPSPPGAKTSDGNLILEVEDEEESWWHSFVNIFKSKKRKGKKGKKDTKKADKKKFQKKIGGKWGERYSISHVQGSVVPNYFPSLRVVEYNITGLENLDLVETNVCSDQLQGQDQRVLSAPEDNDVTDEEANDVEIDKKHKKHKKKKSKKSKKNKKAKKSKKSKKSKFKTPHPPSKSAPPGPAYSPQTLSLLGYVQYYANLTRINNDFHDEDFLNLTPLTTRSVEAEEDEEVDEQKWKEGKYADQKPGKKKEHKKPTPKDFTFEVEYDTKHDKIFKLKDLTVRSYIDLARRIGSFKYAEALALEEEEPEDREEYGDDSDVDSDDDGSDDEAEAEKKKKKKKKKRKHGKKKPKKHVWYEFVKRAFIGTMEYEEIRDQFGKASVPVVESESIEAEL